ncbi:hypothetical protein GGR57DRAFT_287360 [Xylariaceae sp. FL1272]|nr:hypothetical protein GGR57DRAFT_287360 [Xylariaceae sp. FL1272]
MSGIVNKPTALGEKDANNSLHIVGASNNAKAGPKSMEYHRQVLQKKMEQEKYGHQDITTTTTTHIPNSDGPSSEDNTRKPAVKDAHLTSLLDADPAQHNRSTQYISPSDTIMSPCTAKLNALKGRHAGKAKPKSLFAQASAKKFDGENVLGARSADAASSDTNP